MFKKISAKYFLVLTLIGAGLFLISQQPAQGIFTEEEEEKAFQELKSSWGWEQGWMMHEINNKESETYRWTSEHGFDYEKDLYIHQSVEIDTSYEWPSKISQGYIRERLEQLVEEDWEFGEYQANGVGNPKIISLGGYQVYERTYGHEGSEHGCAPPSFGPHRRSGTKLVAYVPQPDNIEEFIEQRDGLLLTEITVWVEVNDEDRLAWHICHPISRSEEKAQQIMTDALAFFQPYVANYISGYCSKNNYCEATLGENCQTCEDCDCSQFNDKDQYFLISDYDFECDPEGAKVAHEQLTAEIESSGQSYRRESEANLLQAHAYGCVIQADCGNGTCDEGEDYESCCKDCPCPKGQACVDDECVPSDIEIQLNYDKKSAIANGRDLINFSAQVTSAGEPIANQDVEITVSFMDKRWDKYIGVGEPDPERGQTGANGIFPFVYKPKLILAEENTLAELEEGTQIWLMVEAKHTKTGKITGRKIYIQPYKPKVTVEQIVPIQALKGMPMVAGKKMVVMVAMKSEEADIFEENEELKLTLDFWINGDEFSPQSKFEQIDISQLSEVDHIIRLMPGDSGHFDQKEFLGIPRTATDEEWVFYNFYVDPQDTHKEGIYIFDTEIKGVYEDSLTGEEKTASLDFASYVDDVYPSGFMSIKVLPLEIGLWYEDFCNFCTISKGPMEQLANFGKRLIGRKVAHDADWEYTCDGSMFAYTWKGIYDDATIERILNTTTVGRLLSGAQIPPRRDACRWGFIDTFLKTRVGPERPLLEELRARGSLAPGSRIVTETQKEKYLKLARASADYLKAVMPLAEENIIIHTQQEPYHLPGLDPNVVLPSYILYKFRDIEAGRVYSNSGLAKLFAASSPILGLERKEYEKSGGPEFHGYTRIAAFVPTGEGKGSNLMFEHEGYESPTFNPWVVLINNDVAEEDVLVHEIAHTYCAIDEDAQARQTAVTPALCGEGGFTINFNWHMDSLGNRVDNGFWVDEREFRGRPGEIQYSFMGAAGRESSGGQQRWVTDDLYYGLGVKLGVFPSEREDYYAERN